MFTDIYRHPSVPGLVRDDECERSLVARMDKTLFFGAVVCVGRFWGVCDKLVKQKVKGG